MVEKRTDIEHAILAPPGAVVERDKSFAKAGRAADIGVEDRDAQLVDQMIVAAQKTRCRLTFRATMNTDDQRPLSFVSGGIGPIEKSRHFLPVEALDLDQFGRDIVGCIEAAGFAPGPAGDRQCVGVYAIGIGTGLVAVQRQAQLAPGREFCTADHAGRKPVCGADLAAFHVVEFEQRTPRLIDFEGDPAAVRADVEIGDVPDFLVDHRFEQGSFEIDDAQPFDVAAIVRCRPEPAVGGELQTFIGDRIAAVRQFAGDATGDVDQIELVVGDRNVVEHQQLFVIRGKIDRKPAAAG